MIAAPPIVFRSETTERAPRRFQIRKAAAAVLALTAGITYLFAASDCLVTAAADVSAIVSEDIFGGAPDVEAKPEENESRMLRFNVSRASPLPSEIEKLRKLGSAPAQPDDEDAENDSGSGAETQEIPEGAYPITDRDMSALALGLTLYDETGYAPDVAEYAMAEIKVPTPADVAAEYGEGAPLVLIIHTHATEAYAPEERSYWLDGESARTTDTEKNVVAVGAVMVETLNARGVPTLHCTVLHDAESYINAYNLAADTIKKYLAEYPSIRYVFDVHRDSLIMSDKTKLRPVTIVNGERTAQFMCVVGTDALGANHPNWRDNFALACRLQSELSGRYPDLCRAINLRKAAFNEGLTSGSLLLEIGSCGNTLAEAKRTAKITADAIANIICGEDGAVSVSAAKLNVALHEETAETK